MVGWIEGMLWLVVGFSVRAGLGCRVGSRSAVPVAWWWWEGVQAGILRVPRSDLTLAKVKHDVLAST